VGNIFVEVGAGKLLKGSDRQEKHLPTGKTKENWIRSFDLRTVLIRQRSDSAMGGEKTRDAVAIVGIGAVGATTAYALMNAGTVAEMILIGRDTGKVLGEVMDLNHGTSFVPPVRIREGNYEDCKDARIVVIAAGVRQKPGESRIALLERNLEVIDEIIPNVTANNPDCIILMVTNPVDALTYAALKKSGFPPGQVIGSGTLLDTSRFRFLLSEHCRVAAQNVHAYIIGEHGDSEVAAWSATNVAGMPFELFCQGCPCGCTLVEKDEIFQSVKNAAYEIIEKKGATFYAIGLAVRRIVQAILRNESVILTVSSLMDGQYGVSDVCVSLPSIVDESGVTRVLEMPLSDEESGGFKASAETLRSNLGKFGL
jgi:L-lactate dehydrogenase